MSWRLLATAVVVCLAGCSVVGGGGAPTPSTTATPADVPDADASQPGLVPPPPGVRNGTVVDAAALVRAHERALVGASYVWRKRLVVRGPDGRLRRRQTVEATVANETRFRYDRRTVRAGQANESFSVYADGTRQYIRMNDPRTDLRYLTTPITSGVVTDVDAFLAARLDDVNATVERIPTDEGPRFLVAADATGETTLRAVVRPDGLIERVSTSFPVDDGRVSYRGTVDVGPTTVAEPDWLPTARNRTDSRR